MSWTATYSRRLLAAGIVNCVIAGLQASAQQPVYEKEEAIPTFDQVWNLNWTAEGPPKLVAFQHFPRQTRLGIRIILIEEAVGV